MPRFPVDLGMVGGFPVGPAIAFMGLRAGSEGYLRTTPSPGRAAPGSFPISLDVFTATCLELDAVGSFFCGLPLRKGLQ